MILLQVKQINILNHSNFHFKQRICYLEVYINKLIIIDFDGAIKKLDI